MVEEYLISFVMDNAANQDLFLLIYLDSYLRWNAILMANFYNVAL